MSAVTSQGISLRLQVKVPAQFEATALKEFVDDWSVRSGLPLPTWEQERDKLTTVWAADHLNWQVLLQLPSLVGEVDVLVEASAAAAGIELPPCRASLTFVRPDFNGADKNTLMLQTRGASDLDCSRESLLQAIVMLHEQLERRELSYHLEFDWVGHVGHISISGSDLESIRDTVVEMLSQVGSDDAFTDIHAGIAQLMEIADLSRMIDVPQANGSVLRVRVADFRWGLMMGVPPKGNEAWQMGMARTNFFSVRDPGAFERWARFNHWLLDQRDQEYALRARSAMRIPFRLYFTEDGERVDGNEADFLPQLGRFLAPGSIAVAQLSAFDGNGNVISKAAAVNESGEIREVCVTDIYDKAARELGGEVIRVDHAIAL